MRFCLGVDDDHTPFVLRFQRDPLLGRSVRRLRGLRPLRTRDRRPGAPARALRPADPRQRGARDGAADHPRRDGAPHRPAARAADRSRSRQLSPAELRALGLHARRGATLVRLCRSVELERLKEQPTAAVADRLERERGLGPWSVGVVCLEGLGRFERGLEGDLGLVKLLGRDARAARRGLGDGRAARAVRRVGRARERLPALRLGAQGLIAGGARRLTVRLIAMSRRVAILGCGKIGESLLAGPAQLGLARRPARSSRPPGARSAIAELRGRYGDRGHALERRGGRRRRPRRRSRSSRRTSRPCSARSARCSRPSRRALRRGRDPDRARSSAHLGADVPGRPLDAERARRRPRGHRRHLRRRATPARSTSRSPRSASRTSARVVRVPEPLHGRGHRGLRLRPRVLRAARRGDDRGRHPARPLPRGDSTQLVVQTMLGTAKLLRDEHMHPVELREAVTSPGRDDDPRDPRARARRRARRVPERDPGGDGALAGAGAGRQLTDVELDVVDDAAAASRGGGARIAEAADTGGHIGLSGGSGPRRAYERVGDPPARLEPASTSGGSTSACVPPADGRSNYRLIRESLLDGLARGRRRSTASTASSRPTRPPTSTTRELEGVTLDSRADRDRPRRPHRIALPERAGARRAPSGAPSPPRPGWSRSSRA